MCGTHSIFVPSAVRPCSLLPPTLGLAPTNVITSNNVSSTIEGRNMFVSWDPPMEGVDNETRYVVEATCSTESTFDDGLPCENPPRLDTPNTDGVIIGLLPGRKYFIRVRALRNGVLSAPACAVNTASIGGMCVCVCACVRACVCVHVWVCVYVCDPTSCHITKILTSFNAHTANLLNNIIHTHTHFTRQSNSNNYMYILCSFVKKLVLIINSVVHSVYLINPQVVI